MPRHGCHPASIFLLVLVLRGGRADKRLPCAAPFVRPPHR